MNTKNPPEAEPDASDPMADLVQRGHAAAARFEPAAERIVVACMELGVWSLETSARALEWLVAKTRKSEGT